MDSFGEDYQKKKRPQQSKVSAAHFSAVVSPDLRPILLTYFYCIISSDYLKAIAALTAFFQPVYNSSLCASSILGSNRFSSFHCVEISERSFQ